jgi:translation initiation factor 3 subunit C
MSRFFATGDTSSESSTSESEDEIPQKTAKPTKKVGFAFSSDEEEEVRVVRSLKDKRFDEIKSHIKIIRNSRKIRDVSRALEGFENMRKVYDKSKSVVETSGIPAFYVRALADLEDFVKELWDDKDVKAKLNKMNSKALSGLRQNLRKYIKDTLFEARIAAYRENPHEFEEDEEDEPVEVAHSDEEPEKEIEREPQRAKPTATVSKPTPTADGDDSDDSIDWMTSESESGSSDDELGAPGTVLHHTMFLKKKGDEGEDEKERKKKEKRQREKPKKDRTAEGNAAEDEWTVVERTKDPHRDMRKALFPNGVENLELPELVKKRGEVMALRGKKGTNAGELVEQMNYLLMLATEKTFGPAIAVKFKLDIVLTILDSAPNVDTPLKEDMWKKLLKHVTDLLDCLDVNRNVVLSGTISELEENLSDESNPFKVYGSVLTIVERMDDEYIKILQGTDSRSNEYVKSLSDEKVVTQLIERAEEIIRRSSSSSASSELCRILMRRIEHLYFKVQMVHLLLTTLL